MKGMIIYRTKKASQNVDIQYQRVIVEFEILNNIDFLDIATYVVLFLELQYEGTYQYPHVSESNVKQTQTKDCRDENLDVAPFLGKGAKEPGVSNIP